MQKKLAKGMHRSTLLLTEAMQTPRWPAPCNVQLGGYNYYEGKPEFREYMGDPDRPLKAEHIKTSIYMMYAAVILFVAVESAVLFFVW